MFDTLIQYWHLTGDAQYNDIVTQGLLAQQGANGDFLPANETKNEGNDDEGQWALAALSAAESQLPEPAGVSWAGLAENVFNSMAARWDTTNCDGGLRWQIFPFLTGYDYKNTVSNAYFFQLASRLALYTGNSTYSDWASKTFDWTTSAGFIDTEYNVYDGAHIATNCTDINKVQFSYVAGAFISGAAHMYNSTSGDVKWETALNGLLNRTSTVFFPNDVASEIACQNHDTCTVDMKAFKGLLAHWLVDTVQVAPYTSQRINSLLSTTAEAAAKSCDSTGCPLVWDGSVTGKVDGAGVGEVMSALSFVQGLLVSTAAAPIKEGESVNATTTSSGGRGVRRAAVRLGRELGIRRQA